MLSTLLLLSIGSSTVISNGLIFLMLCFFNIYGFYYGTGFLYLGEGGFGG